MTTKTAHILIGLRSGDSCYFLGRKWEVVECNTNDVLESISGIRSGHRILLGTTGATFQ